MGERPSITVNYYGRATVARKGFARRYDEAKRIGILVYAEKAFDEAKDDSNDHHTDEKGRRAFNGQHAWRSKLIVDTIKWQVGKMLPKLPRADQPRAKG